MRSILTALVFFGTLSLVVACDPTDEEDDRNFPDFGPGGPSGPTASSGSTPGTSSGQSSSGHSSSGESSSGQSSSGQSSGGSAPTPVAFKAVPGGSCRMEWDGKVHDGNSNGGTPPTGWSDGHNIEVTCIYVEGGKAMAATIAMGSIEGPGTYKSGQNNAFGTATFSYKEKDSDAQVNSMSDYTVTLSVAGNGQVVGGAELSLNGKPALVSFNLAKAN